MTDDRSTRRHDLTRRKRARHIRGLTPCAGIIVVIAILGLHSLSSSSQGSLQRPGEPRRADEYSVLTRGRGVDESRRENRDALGKAGGAIRDGASALSTLPGVTKLDPDLLRAVRRAAADAAASGITINVDSGWRSPAYQQQLLHQAVSTYGSEAEAARWVATPTTSAHVAGRAVDIGPAAAAAWLSAHGAAYRLCQIYANESWHYELRAHAADRGCPAMYADPTHDPRMQQ